MREPEERDEELDLLESITIVEDDGTERELYLVDQTRVNGEDYLLLTDTQEDGGEGYIYKMSPDPEDEEEMLLTPVEESEYDYIAGIFAEQCDVDFT